MSDKRRYELRKRGEQMADTRRRIVEATVELHRTVGPAATRISEVAERAGVRRVTVYSHFPDDAALLSACSAHWRSLHPVPDPSAWVGAPEPGTRLRLALAAIYAWYRETEPMTANVLRDMERLPDLRVIIDAGLGRYLGTVRDQLFGAMSASSVDPETTRSALDVALGFQTWKALSALGDDRAAGLMARFVDLAAMSAPPDLDRADRAPPAQQRKVLP